MIPEELTDDFDFLLSGVIDSFVHSRDDQRDRE